MADPQSESLSPSTSSESEYRPISGLAVASLICSGLFALILLVFVLLGFFTKKPIDESWHLLFAVLGFALAIIARIQIRQSEGLRSGLQLTVIAWWISVIGGGGYFAYLKANETTLRIQSGTFADEWFKVLKTGKEEAGFLYLIDPERRSDPSLNIDDPSIKEVLELQFGGLWNQFKNHELVQLIRRNRDSFSATSQGVRGWEYTSTGTRIDWTYRISSAEGVGLCSISLLGKKPKGERTIAWNINVNTDSGFRRENQTTFGRVFNEDLIPETTRFIMTWLGNSRPGTKYSAYIRTLPPDQRDKLETQWVEILASAPLQQGLFVPPDLPEMLDLGPEFFKNEQGQAPTPEELSTFRSIWRDGEIRFVGASQGGATHPGSPLASFTDQGIKFRFPIELPLPSSSNIALGYLVVACIDPALNAQLKQLHDEGMNRPNQPDDQKVTIRNKFNDKAWQIMGIESNLRSIQQREPANPTMKR
jgi:hypothetical protein